MRLGYLLGDPSLIQPILEKTRDSYNVDALSQAWISFNSRPRLRPKTQQYAKTVRCSPGCAPWVSRATSQTNFAGPSSALYRLLYSLKASGILVRYSRYTPPARFPHYCWHRQNNSLSEIKS